MKLFLMSLNSYFQYIYSIHMWYIWWFANKFPDWLLKTEWLTLDIRDRHHVQSGPLLRLDNNPSGATSFWSILGSHFLVACSGRLATVLKFPPASEIFAPLASFSVLEIRNSRWMQGPAGREYVAPQPTYRSITVESEVQHWLTHCRGRAAMFCTSTDQVVSFANSPVDFSKLRRRMQH